MDEHFAPISRERYAELLEAEQRLAAAEQKIHDLRAESRRWTEARVAVLRMRGEMPDRLATAEQERDQALQSRDHMQRLAAAAAVNTGAAVERLDAAEARLTRLAPLEAAARALDDTMQWPRDRTVACTTVPVELLRAVRAALKALDGPAGEAGWATR